MTEHNGLPVAGYKPQSDEKVALVNEFKQDEERLLRKIEMVARARVHKPATLKPFNLEDEVNLDIDMPAYDGRFLAIAKTHFQEGFMALNRAVFQPGRVKLPEDE